MKEDIGEDRRTMGEVIHERLEEVDEKIDELAKELRRIIQYVVVIGALNGSVTVGKIAEEVISYSSPNIQQVSGGLNEQ